MRISLWAAIALLVGMVLSGSVWLTWASPPPLDAQARPVVDRTPVPTVAVPGNVLANSSFEGQYTTWPGTDNVNVPPHWTPWWNTGPNDHRPEYGESNLIDWYRVHSGVKAQKYFNVWSTTSGTGLYQQVRVAPGALLEGRAWVHAWSGYWCADTPGFFLLPQTREWPTSLWRDQVCTRDLDPENIVVKVGIDPYGGADANSPNVVWTAQTDWYGHYDIYTQTQPVQAYARAPTATLFLRSQVKWGFKMNDVYWDDASLVAVGPPAGFASIQPARPELGQPTTIQVASYYAHPNATLTITDPLSATTTLTGGTPSGGEPYVWTWHFTPNTVPGTYTLAFSADTLSAPITTTVRAVAVAHLAAQPATPWLSQTVTVRATSYHVYHSPRLTVTTPGGHAIAPWYQGGTLTRTWHFASAVTGTHRLTYTANLLEAPATASVNVVSVAGSHSTLPAPPISTPVAIQMWAYYPYTSVVLALTDPQGAPLTPNDLGRTGGQPFVWTWAFTPTMTGTHRYTITAYRLDVPARGFVFAGGYAVYLPIVMK